MDLIILDRDGVINFDSDAYIRSPGQWRPIPGSLEAIARLHQRGHRVVVASNQSGIARGLFTLDTLHAIHRAMLDAVSRHGGAIDAVVFCPSCDDSHPQRKPNPGMLWEIARRLAVPLAGVPFIGDSLGDVVAALRAGATPVLVRTGKGCRTEARLATAPETQGHPVPVFDDLAAAVDQLLKDSPA
ncbi:MAG: D-glycero-beta-D-manno-heptose 1,7-bisphosphate 7-phosphatase [Candidatus Competibacterales bacterium]